MSENTRSNSKKGKSNLTFLHDKKHIEIKNNTVTNLEEVVRDGDRGISFKYYSKEGDKTVKVTGFQTGPDGKFNVKVVRDKNVESDDKDLSLADVLKLLKGIKGMEFATKYLSSSKKQSGGYYHYCSNGGRRQSRSGSKKGSRKGSRKGSKKGSRRGSRRMSSRGSTSRSRSRSRKGSKKSSRKSRK